MVYSGSSAVFPSAGIKSSAELVQEASSCMFSNISCAEVPIIKKIIAVNKADCSRLHCDTIKLQRTFCLYPEMFNSFIELVSCRKQLKKLDVSGNRAGPVAFRALLLSLNKHDFLEELDISDNNADIDCAEIVRTFISSSSALRKLNLSGNKLGQASISRSLSVALLRSTSSCPGGNITVLNISNCGIKFMHGLFEGLRDGMSFETSCLKHLNISNNIVQDSQQLGLDISTVLEHQKCILEHLNIINVGLCAVGFDSILGGLRNNHSLTELYAGGVYNHIKHITKIKDMLFASTQLSVLNLKDIVADEPCKSSKGNRGTFGTFDYNISLSEVNLNNCNLTEHFFSQLLPRFAGKLATVKLLDISYNKELCTLNGLSELLLTGNTCCLNCLNLSGLKLNCLCSVLESFNELHTLVLNDSELPYHEFLSLCDLSESLNHLCLDGVIASPKDVISVVSNFPLRKHITKLSLSGCSLSDEDIDPLIHAACLEDSNPLQLSHLDISNNKLEHGVCELFDSLCKTKGYPLEDIEVANNLVTDEGALSITKFVLNPRCKSMLQRVNISGNSLTCVGMLELIRSMVTKSTKTELVYVDISNQADLLSEDEFENVAKELVDVILDNHGFSCLKDESNMSLPAFYVNLNQLQKVPSQKPFSRLLALASGVHTDFSQVVSIAATLTDYLLFAAGLDKNSIDPTSVTECGNTAAFTCEQWDTVIGLNAPKYLKSPNDRKTTLLLNYLPSGVTSELMRIIFESSANCCVKQVDLVNNYAFKEFTNCAWMLCKNEESLLHALAWFAAGKAAIQGSLISVSFLPVTVLNAKSRIEFMAKREKHERYLQKKQEKETLSGTGVPLSKLIDEETAIYLELNPKR